MRLFLLLLLLPCCTQTLFATHIVGGEITYKCLGDNNYAVTLTVYRDCYNGQPWFDNPASLGVFDQNWNLVGAFNLLLMPDDTIPIILSNPCLTAPPDVCVHRTSYQAIINLPFLAGGYTLVYQRCCRNKLIRNIPFPEDVGASFIVNMSETTLTQCNSSAVFNNWPPVAICVNEPIDFDHAATDPDGDSLVYRLCTPLNGADAIAPQPTPPNPGPYQEITWLDPPYNLLNVLGGQALMINSATGFITGVPNKLGNYVVGVCVDEYRADSIISTTRRDFQYNVADCGTPYAAFFTPSVQCDTLGISIDNQSQSADSYKWYFDWTGDKTQTSLDFSPMHTYPDTGYYTIALIAQPNDPCRDTAYQTIHVTLSPTVTVTATPAFITIGGSSQLTAVYPGSGPYMWTPPATLSDSSIANPVAMPPVTTVYTVVIPDSTGECPLIGQARVVVQPFLCDEPYLFFPTAFSPNGDGENDFLKFESNFTESVYWVIYNRWGEKVFEASTISDKWDGTLRGVAQPVETYGYYLRAVCAGGQLMEKKGNVTLLR